jgi:hypothetical protein
MLDSGPPRRPQTFGGVVYLAVLAVTVAGLATAGLGAWRTGVSWVGGALVVAAGCRLLLSEHRAGMLRVRRKGSDVTMLALAGVALIVLAVVVPNQPGG